MGLIVPELTNPIFSAFAEIMGGLLARDGYTPVLCIQAAGGVHEDDYVQMLLDRRVSGIIFIAGRLSPPFPQLGRGVEIGFVR